jgi:hypothetical protein
VARCAFVVTLLVLVLPASAGATITASTVDTTGGPFFGVNENGPGLVIHGHVTSDATATDRVKLVCDGFGELRGSKNAGYPINPNGSVDVNVGFAMDYYYCLARLVPLAATAPYDPAFVPSPIGLLGYYDYSFVPPDDVGGPYDWWQSVSGPAGYADAYSLGDCSFGSTYTINATYGYQQLLACSGVFAKDPVDNTRSMIRLDGSNALTPFHASASFSPADVPRITNLRRDINNQTGEVIVSATEPLALCPSACSSPTPAGVHADHSFHGDHGGRLATTVDVWHNDGSVPVTMDVSYEFVLQNVTGQFQLPGQTAFAAPPDGALPTPPAGPGFMRAVGKPAEPDGSEQSVRGAIAWSAAPNEVEGVAADRGVILRYHRTIAPAGSFRITFGTATTLAQGDADALAAEMIAATKPTIAITAPADGATTGPDTATVTGTATDDGGPPAIDVNGVAASVAGDGSWSATVPVPADPTTITATATDADGNTASATRTVHQAGRAVVSPAIVLPTVIAPSLKHVRVKVSRKGTVTVSADVPSSGRFAAKVRAKVGKRRLTISSARKTVAAAGRATLKLKPSKRARAVLRKRGLRATLALSFTSAGKTATASRKMRLKRLPRVR